jgi:hypothetical protein
MISRHPGSLRTALQWPLIFEIGTTSVALRSRDRRLGGKYRARVFCQRMARHGARGGLRSPERLLVLTTEPDQPAEQSIEVTLTATAARPLWSGKERGMPVAYLAGYGAGIQVHVEDLDAYLAGRRALRRRCADG